MLSYSRGPQEELWELTIGQVLDRGVERWGDSLALVSCHQSKRYTWRELRDAAEAVARGLAVARDTAGRSGGTVVHELCRVDDGAPGMRAGRSGAGQCESGVSHARAGVHAAKVANEGLVPVGAGQPVGVCRRSSKRRGHGPDAELEHVDLFWHCPLDRIADCNGRDSRAAIEPGDVANIQYTSGTTGQPKGVMLTHRNLVNNGRMLAGGMRFTERDRICVPVPMYHCFGCVIGTMSALASGAAIILPNWTFDAARHAAGHAGGAGDVALRRARDVHRGTGPAGFQVLRLCPACAPA